MVCHQSRDTSLFRSVLIFGRHDEANGVSSMRGSRLVQSDKAAPAREIQLLIGEALKAQYDRGLPEPIPDRLGELLKQLAQLELLKEIAQLMDEPDSKGG
jgi:hypothetical protein